MGISIGEGVLAVVLIALSWQGGLCATRPEGESCSSFFKDSVRGTGTRFQKATEAGDLTCMREFHDAGDNVNQHNRNAEAPIHTSAFSGNVDTLKLLIEFGADLNKVQYLFGTALAIAACKGFPEYAKVLLAAGADKSITNSEGETPLARVCTCSSCSDGTAEELKKLLGGGGCAVIANTDFPSQSGILNDGKNYITSTNEECCKKCNERSDCKAWTRIQSDTQYNKAGECWMRNFVPEKKFCAACASGLKA